MALFGLFGRRMAQSERMFKMIDRLGVDGVALAEDRPGQDLRSAESECQKCMQVGKCEAWLAGEKPDAEPYVFCPNGALFAEHRRK